MSDDQFPNSIPTSQPHIYRPIPRRTFERPPEAPTSAPAPAPPSRGTSDFAAQLTSKLLRSRNVSNVSDDSPETTPSRSKSFLNMQSSTLFGIYSDAGTSADRTEPATPWGVATPWGTGAETPARISMDNASSYWDSANSSEGVKTQTLQRQRMLQDSNVSSGPKTRPSQGARGVVRILRRGLALFWFGVVYGILISHLHDYRSITPIQVQGIDRDQWGYCAAWGVAGIILGSLLPYIDLKWDTSDQSEEQQPERKRRTQQSPLGDQWNPVVRSVGAFVGIAFAIRRLHWQSTLQLSATMAMVNPVLWYLLDRSTTGFTVSTLVSTIFTSIFLFAKPDVVPSPALAASNSTRLLGHANFGGNGQMTNAGPELFVGVVSYESLGAATWIASVLFCSCICFGNIGRKLATFDD